MSKKSFIIHFDSLDVLDELTDEQAGQLFKAISEYQKTGKNSLKGVLKAVFIPFKNQFDRDNEKYKSICERNKNNGLKGGRPKPKITQKTQSVNLVTQNNPNKPDNDSDSDNDSKKEESSSWDRDIPDNPRWFDGEVIKLRKKDYEVFMKMSGYSDDSLHDLLLDRDRWFQTQPTAKQKNWYISTKAYLERPRAAK